ncbi:MAG: hypothetical protein R2705_20265 [Ilumatobacteraceae bacterium]
MVFQDPMTSLDPVQRIGRQLTEPMRAHLGLDRALAKKKAIELLSAVGVPDPERRLRIYPHELSGGLRQRVAIAIALPAIPMSSSPMSPPAPSTSRSRPSCSTCSTSSSGNGGSRCCSSLTISASWRAGPTRSR